MGESNSSRSESPAFESVVHRSVCVVFGGVWQPFFFCLSGFLPWLTCLCFLCPGAAAAHLPISRPVVILPAGNEQARHARKEGKGGEEGGKMGNPLEGGPEQVQPTLSYRAH